MANDRTAEYVIKLIGRDEDLRRKVQGAIADMQKMGKEAGVLTGANAAIMKSLGGIAAAGAAAFTTKAMIDYTREAANLAATGEGIRAAFAKLNQPGLLDELKRATRGTASEMKLMQTAIQAQNFKIPLTQLATYLKFATNRALETGQSVDYLVESLITGIGRQSPLILDNLGLSAIEISEAFKKAGDFGLAVGQIIQKELAKSGDVAETSAVKIQRNAATVENLKEAWGKAVNAAGIWQEQLDGITDKLEKTTVILNARSIPAWERFFGILKTGIGIDDTFKAAEKALVDDEIRTAYYTAKKKEKQGEFVGWSIKELEKLRQTQLRINDATAKETIAKIDAEIARLKEQAQAQAKVGEVKRRTLAEVNTELQEAVKLQGEVNVYDRAAVAEINKKVGALTAEKEAYEKLFAVQKAGKPRDTNRPAEMKGPAPASATIAQPVETVPGLQKSSVAANEMTKTLEEMKQKAAETRDAISQLGGSFGILGSAIGGAAGSWIGFAGTITEQVPALITTIKNLQDAQAIANAKSIIGTNADTAASLTNSSAKQTEAMSSGISGAAKLPFPASLLAIAAVVATIGSIIAAIPKPKKFAAGGIISGPTLGLMGEYPGASNNPEVVAPLDKLKGMIGERSGAHITIDEIVLTGDKIRIVQKVAERRLGRYN